MSAESAGSTVEHAGFTVTSSDPQEAAAASLSQAEPEAPEGEGEGDPVSKAASELGKRGGKAAAKARAAREAEPEKPEEKAPAPKADDTDPDDEDEDDDEISDEERPAGKPRKDPVARIRQLAEKRRAAEARATAAEARAEQLAREFEAARRQPAAPERPAEPERPRAPEGKPKSEDFDSYEEYLDARDTWNRKQWTEEQAQHRQVEERTHRIRSMAATFQGEVQKARQADAEFDSRVSPEILALKPSFVAIQYRERPDGRHFIADELVQEPADAPRLMVYLSKHKQEFQRIAALQSPREVTRALAKIVTRLDAATTATSSGSSVSKAPAPVRSVTGAPPTAGEPFREGMDFDEWLSKRSGKAAAR